MAEINQPNRQPKKGRSFFAMKKINIDDIVLVPGEKEQIKLLVTRVNITTFQGLDLKNNSNTYFIKEISN